VQRRRQRQQHRTNNAVGTDRRRQTERCRLSLCELMSELTHQAMEASSKMPLRLRSSVWMPISAQTVRPYGTCLYGISPSCQRGLRASESRS
jgi:hypothetical protein